jgi:hypothetical protein
MGHLTLLPAAFLVNIHQRLFAATRLRDALALESTCKELRRLFHEHAEWPLVKVTTAIREQPGFWRWLARNGRRVDHLAFTIGPNDLDAPPGYGFPAMCQQAGIQEADMVEFRLEAVDNLQHLDTLHNLTALDWQPASSNPAALEPLARLTALQALELTGSRDTSHASALAPLASLPALTRLRLRQLGVTSVTVLRTLSTTRLQHLTLDSLRSVTCLDPLSCLTSLTSLELSYCSAVVTLAPLHALSNLQQLHVKFTQPTADLGFLSALTQLRSLQLSGSTDLRPLASLRGSLRTLHLRTRDGFDSCGALSAPVGLTQLTLAAGKPDHAKMAFLRPLTRLQRLIISGDLSDLTPIGMTTTLQTLLLHTPAITTLAPLTSLASLSMLFLSRCSGLASLEPLAALTNLKALHIQECPRLSGPGCLAPLGACRRLTVSGDFL